MAEIPETDNTLPENRLVEQVVAKWLAAAFATVRAGDLDESATQAVDELQHLHLSGADYALVPQILDALRKAGLLRDGRA